MFNVFVYTKLGHTLYHHTTMKFVGNQSTPVMMTLDGLCTATEYLLKFEPIYARRPRDVINNGGTGDNNGADYVGGDQKEDIADDGDEDKSVKPFVFINGVPIEIRFDRWLQIPIGSERITIKLPPFPTYEKISSSSSASSSSSTSTSLSSSLPASEGSDGDVVVNRLSQKSRARLARTVSRSSVSL